MPPEAISVVVAEYTDASVHHDLEVQAPDGVSFGPPGAVVPGAVLVRDASGAVIGLWVPIPAAP
jgi:hypothetical protein